MAFLALGAGIIRLMGLPFGLGNALSLPPTTASHATSPDSGIVVLLPADLISPSGETPTPPSHAPTVSVTLIGPRTAADSWANAILDRTVKLFEAGLKPGDGFAWWQSRAARASLSFADGSLTLSGAAFDPSPVDTLMLAIPDPSSTNQLTTVGSIEAQAGSQILTAHSSAPSETDIRWILTGSRAALPLQALAVQAAARSVSLEVVYSQSGGAEDDLVLVGIKPFPGPGSTTQAASPVESPTSAALTPSATATRTPDVVLGRIVAGKLDPVIDAMRSVLPESASVFASQHPLIGPLTWTENGPRIAGRLMGVSQAARLDLVYLAPNVPDGLTFPLLNAVTDGDVTRLPDEQAYFQGQRMDEILYWMVYHSAARGGILFISYDDFGARQTISVVGFEPFSTQP